MPQERHGRRAECDRRDRAHPREQAQERADPPRPRHHRQQEDAQDRAVEERAEAVHDLDERAQADGVDRHEAREHAPERGRDLGHREVVGVGRLWSEPAPIEVDDAGRRQRVQLGRDAGHGRGDDGRDEQAREADRQLTEDEAGDDVVDVAGGFAGDVLRHGQRLGADELDGRFPGEEVVHGCLAGGVLGGGIVRAGGRHRRRRRLRRCSRFSLRRGAGIGGGQPGRAASSALPQLQRLAVAILESFVLGAPGVDHRAFVGGVVQQRRGLELVVDEDHHADEKDERLERDLPVGAHQERGAGGVDGFGGQVALDLGLVGAEVGQHEEGAADEARPEGVRLVDVEREVEDLEAACGAGDVERFARGHGHFRDQDDDDRQQREDDEDHLFHVGPGDRLDAAEHGVRDGRDADQGDAPEERPAEDRREDHGGGSDDHAAGHAAREQEEERGEGAGARVEAAFQVLVGGVDAGAAQERHEGDAEDDHRERQAEVELHEAEAVGGALSGGADHGDGGELGRHDREADRPPREAAARQEVAFDLVGAAGAADAVDENVRDVGADDQPVDGVHGRVVGLSRGRWPAGTTAGRG